MGNKRHPIHRRESNLELIEKGDKNKSDALPSVGGSASSKNSRVTPGSAKQHYLQRSRYYPGAPNAPLRPSIEGRIINVGSGKKLVELTSGNVKESSSKHLLGELKRSTYLPSAEDKTKTRSQRLAGGGTIWKPPALAPKTFNQVPAQTSRLNNLRMGGIPGRTDWTNKYGRGGARNPR